ncbi:hypothetical protein R5R35_007464 [Gryllus longicercus]|uniref:Hemolymph juvenile hormone binding protein n=1 Tax=Gryllus longicercus TaxID=2509291 RepID=A0AAN9V358_9ORTH
MFSKAMLALVLGALALSAALPQRPAAPLPVEELANMPREQAVALLKDLLRGPLQQVVVPAMSSPATRGLIDDQIVAQLERLRVVMKEGSEALGVPVLDPLHVNHVEAHTHQSLIDFDGSLDDFVIQGLSDFIIDNIKFSTILLTFNFGFTMPKVSVTGKYDLDSILGNLLPIYGEGPFKVDIGDVVVSGKAKLALKNIVNIYVKSLTLDFSVGEYHSDIDGMLGGGDLSDLLNEVINDLVPEIIDANADLFADVLAEQIVVIANTILGEMTLQDLLDLIAGGSS